MDTATGRRLGQRLRQLAPHLEAGLIPAVEGRLLSGLLDRLEAKHRREAAILAAVAILSAGVPLSRHCAARRLAAALVHHRRHYRRVQWGQVPATALDVHLAVISEGAQSWRSLWDELDFLQ
jgi:hypothetical protein